MMNGKAYKDHNYTCENCNWTGSGEDCPQRELFQDLFEIDCPRCGDKIDIVSFPNHAEIEAELQRLQSQTIKVENADKMTLALNLGGANTHKSIYLENKFQLPDIDEDFIILTWDATDKEPATVVIKHGSKVVWTEPVVYGKHERFIDVCNIFKEKYGLRLRDIVPTPKGEHNLCGDSYTAKEILAIFRESFSNTRL